MAKKKEKKKNGEPAKPQEFVPVIYARSATEAEFYKGLLTSNDIPAVIEEEAGEVIGMPSSIVGQGVPILVPDELLDEASEIIAEHGNNEEEEELDEYEDIDEESDDLDEEFDDDDELDDEAEDEDEELDDLDDDLDDDDVDDLDELDEEEEEKP
ncbi:MAG: DUF2007 domain-containing protein [Phycisphaerae bacterium]|nr:DUF2007 domain-containing protein [Phycisphaerae bacterium]